MTGVHLERRGAVAVLTLDNPPVNGFGMAIRRPLGERLEACLADDTVAALVLTGGGRMFSGGADITEFNKPILREPPTLHDLIATIEASPKPIVAAIHGFAAGGGCEVALACHYRVATTDSRIGLPEVTLGLIPGAGGTQRLPRLIGVEPALRMIVAGELAPAAKALELGLLDEIAEGNVAAAATALAERIVAEGAPPRRTGALDDKIAAARGKPEIFTEFRNGMARRARGLEAPYACVESVEAAVTLPFAEGLAREREIFQRCVDSDQSKALRHVFFAEREAARIPDIAADTPARTIASAAVVGAGTMGGGIAMNFANAGIPVTILEVSDAAIAKGLDTIRKNYAATVARGRLSQDDMDRRMALMTATTDETGIAQADIVIEAVFEDMALKKEVFRRLDGVCKPDAILASNTSTLDVDEIAAVTSRPGQVMGTHFFSPANVMRLMENVRGGKTSPETLATVMKLSRTLGKVAVPVGVCDGFVGNRMLAPYFREADFLVEEGALPQQVDKVIYDFGFAMGPFAVSDLAGLDVAWLVRKARAAKRPAQRRYSPIADRICEMGRFGQKTGAGWYRYAEGDRTPRPDPKIEALIVAASKELGIARRAIDDREILERCMYPLINEGAKILDEGIAYRSGDIDVIWIHGYGFPRQRGGPMYYADRIGLKTVYDTMSRFYDVHGEPMKPAPLLERLAREGKGFADL